jgi:hypothetical protein
MLKEGRLTTWLRCGFWLVPPVNKCQKLRVHKEAPQLQFDAGESLNRECHVIRTAYLQLRKR